MIKFPVKNSIKRTDQQILISVVIPITERYDPLEKIYEAYSKAINDISPHFEFIFVIDGGIDSVFKKLVNLKKNDPHIRIIKFTQRFGESTCLTTGFNKAKGRYIFTLSSYFQVEPYEIKKLYKRLEQGVDLVVSRRYPRYDSFINKMQSFLFHSLLHFLLKSSFHDISCGLRGFKREIIKDLEIYGDLHRFIPIIAQGKGFKVEEIPVKQRKEDAKLRVFKPTTYIQRILDINTIYFLTKFIQKPLRFYGLIGFGIFLIGLVITCYLGILRFFNIISLVDKPLLLLGILLLVLGIQLFSLGFIGEMVIYTHAESMKNYTIEEIIE